VNSGVKKHESHHLIDYVPSRQHARLANVMPLAEDFARITIMSTGQLELRWIASTSSSALHAAAYIAAEIPLVDADLGLQLAEPAHQLHAVMTAALGPWDHLLPLSAGIETNRELAEVTLRKARGAAAVETHRDRLANAIAEVERVFRNRFPGAVDELELRSRPLREQWEARGPGLLRNVVDLTEEGLLVEQADVVLLTPVFGGRGRAFPAYNSVHIEAVLANPVNELPEVVRLAWLLAQLNLDLPRFTERITNQKIVSLIVALAMIPPVLQAAQHVELARYEEANLQRAAETWYPEHSTDVGPILFDWWTTYQETRPAFSIALRALEKMIFS